MELIAIKCRLCKDTIYSRSNHDLRHCTCGAVFIDGGQSGYYRVGGSEWDRVPLNVEVTEKVLYNDWNYSKNKFGLIKEKKVKRATKTKS